MIFKGRYLQTTLNNPLAPFVEALVRTTDGKWVNVTFLIDLGADGTYLPSEYMEDLGTQLDEAQTEDNVTGVGGQRAEYVPFTTQLRFESHGVLRTFDTYYALRITFHGLQGGFIYDYYPNPVTD